jgi:drug/metabolite transporter (DMT)-like permease
VTTRTVAARWQLGLALAACTALLWGLLPIAIAVVLGPLDAVSITALRFAAAAAILFAWLSLRQRLPAVSRLDRGAWATLAVACAGLAGNYVLYVLGLDATTPTVAQTVIQVAPLLLLLAGVLLLRERFGRVQWAGFAALVLGLALFFNRRLPELLRPSEGLGLGVALLLASAASWAAYGVAQKRLLAVLDPVQVLWIVFTAAAAALLPFARLEALPALDAVAAAMLAFACVNTAVAYVCFARALDYWDVSRVSAAVSVAPLVTLAAMWAAGRWLPGLVEPEGLTATSVSGALCVVGGSALAALGSRRPHSPR